MTTPRRVLPLAFASVVALVTALPARAIWEVAEGEMFLLLDASVANDSNIGSNALEISDTIYTVTPGFSWERSRGRGSVSLGAKYEIERAQEFEGYDSENFSATFSLKMPVTAGRRLTGGVTASYFDGSRVDPYQNTRISESSYKLGVNGSYQVTNKTNARAGFTYSETDPETLAGYESTSFKVGAGYNLRPEVSLFVDARFTSSTSQRGVVATDGTETTGRAILVGIDGQITQRLTGSIGFGYDKSESENAGTTSEHTGLTYDVGLTWTPRQRTSVDLSASNSIESTSVGGTDHVRVNLTLSQEIGMNVSAHAGVTYRRSDFDDSGRSENDVWEGTVGATYAFSRQISLGLSYSYTDAESSNAIVNYTKSVWRLTASARF